MTITPAVSPKVKETPAKTEKAIILRKYDSFLIEAFELTIVGGKVVDERKLTRAPDTLSIAEHYALKALLEGVRPK